jgi:hypothetical protein
VSAHPLCPVCRDTGLVALGNGERTLCPDCHTLTGESYYCTNTECELALGHDVPVIPAVYYGDYPSPAEMAYDECPRCRHDLTGWTERLPKHHPYHFVGTELGERYARRYLLRGERQ